MFDLAIVAYFTHFKIQSSLFILKNIKNINPAISKKKFLLYFFPFFWLQDDFPLFYKSWVEWHQVLVLTLLFPSPPKFAKNIMIIYIWIKLHLICALSNKDRTKSQNYYEMIMYMYKVFSKKYILFDKLSFTIYKITLIYVTILLCLTLTDGNIYSVAFS